MKRITLVGELERGAHGILYRAHDARSGRAVSVRVPPHAWPPEATLMAASKAGVLRHPHLAPVLEAGWHGGRAYVVLGEELDIAVGPGELRETIAAVRDAAKAVEAAAAEGLVHPGPAPELLRRTRDGRWVLTGYELPGDPTSDARFRAPEGAVDVASNVYSLAAILAELTADAPRLDELEALLRSAKDVDPKRRPSPEAFVRGLEGCLEALGPSKDGSWSGVPLPAPLLAGTGLLALLGLVGLLPARDAAPAPEKTARVEAPPAEKAAAPESPKTEEFARAEAPPVEAPKLENVAKLEPAPEPVPELEIALPPLEPPIAEPERRNVAETILPSVGTVKHVHAHYGVFLALDERAGVAVGDALEARRPDGGVALLKVRRLSRPEPLYPHGAAVCDAAEGVAAGQVVVRKAAP